MGRKTPIALWTAASLCCGPAFPLFAGGDLEPPPPAKFVATAAAANQPAATSRSAPVKNIPVSAMLPIDYNFGSSNFPSSDLLKLGQNAVDGSVHSESADATTSSKAVAVEKPPAAAPATRGEAKESPKPAAVRSTVGAVAEHFSDPPTLAEVALKSPADVPKSAANAVAAPAPIPPAQLSTPLPRKPESEAQGCATAIPRAGVYAAEKEMNKRLETVSATRRTLAPMSANERGLDAVTGRSLENPAAPTPAALEFDQNVAIDCLRVLGSSPIDADREQALGMLARMRGWQQYRPIYQTLRRVALTEYNTRMRATAVQMLGTATSDHQLVADALRLSAQYDSEPAIQSYAQSLLERLASLPAENFAR